MFKDRDLLNLFSLCFNSFAWRRSLDSGILVPFLENKYV